MHAADSQNTSAPPSEYPHATRSRANPSERGAI